jgi:hypothetical protein
MATKASTPEEMAQRRAGYLTGFLWHAGTFVIINVFFWTLDGLGYGGITWSFWITIFWGLALAFHGLAYLIDGRQIEERKTKQYLDEQR